MQSSLEFYLSPLATKHGSPFDIQSTKSARYEEVSILHLFQLHVQRLFDYGMHLCSERGMVTESLVAVFVHMRDPNNSSSTQNAVRLSLFKRFRKDLSEHMFAVKKSDRSSRLESNREDAGWELSQNQREAIFLKVKCEFSYEEVAAIMDIRMKSAHNLVSQALEKMLQQNQK